MAKSELSAVEQHEAAAQAKREATPIVPPAQAAMPVAPASEPKPEQSLRIVFDAKTGQTKRGARYLATAQLLGCFGSAPVTVGGFVLALDGRDIAVYMPGSQYSRDIRPRQILINGGPIEVAGKIVTHRALALYRRPCIDPTTPARQIPRPSHTLRPSRPFPPVCRFRPVPGWRQNAPKTRQNASESTIGGRPLLPVNRTPKRASGQRHPPIPPYRFQQQS